MFEANCCNSYGTSAHHVKSWVNSGLYHFLPAGGRVYKIKPQAVLTRPYEAPVTLELKQHQQHPVNAGIPEVTVPVAFLT